MPDPQVRIRLYGGLLGDCSLLRFPRPDGTAFTMLIDFGVLQHMPDGEARLPLIAADVMAETGGKLDVVAATHRHWDHVCGFGKAPAFATAIDQVWLSWIENPHDPQGAGLTGAIETTGAALASAANAAGPGLAASGDGEQLRGLLGFLGLADGDGDGAAMQGGQGAAGHITTRSCLDALRARGTPVYLDPGAIVALADTGVRAFVLGPPRDEARLRDQDPSPDGHEVYPLAMDLGAAVSVPAATAQSGSPDVDPLARPFDESVDFWPMPDDDTPSGLAWMDALYAGKGNEWRRIDAAGASALALRFDNIVNNTSLVLAFELPGTKHVLLFPADAQVGNWLSWHDVKWPDGEGVTTDLLARTVFLKTAHHGSVNATVREGGLEAMTSPLLSSFIPVVETFARTKKPSWDMPHGPTLDRLMKMTNGRVARGDRPAPVITQPDAGAFTAKYLEGDAVNPFWIEYSI